MTSPSDLPVCYHKAKAFEEYLQRCFGLESEGLEHALFEVEVAYKKGDTLRMGLAEHQLHQVMKSSEEGFRDAMKELEARG